MNQDAIRRWNANPTDATRTGNTREMTTQPRSDRQLDSDREVDGFSDAAEYSNPGSDIAPLSDFDDNGQQNEAFSNPRAPSTPDSLNPIGSDTFSENVSRDGFEYSFEPPTIEAYEDMMRQAVPLSQNTAELERKVEATSGTWDHIGLIQEDNSARCKGCCDLVSAIFASSSVSERGVTMRTRSQTPDVQICIHDTWNDLVECANFSCKLCLFIKYEIENRNSLQDSKQGVEEGALASQPVRGGITFHAGEKEVHFLDFWVGGIRTAEEDLGMRGSRLKAWYQQAQSVQIRQLNEMNLPNEQTKMKINQRLQLQTKDTREVQYEAARQWIQDCTVNHERCRDRQSESTNYLPNRFLEVGTNDDPVLRLINSKDVTIRSVTYAKRTVGVEYAILSYCWGKGGHAFGTTLQNVEERYISMDEGTFPQTWKDAVAISRGLGLRYLWIDALCIIQSKPGEDMSDWQNQFPFMGLIYRNSVCAIAASGASSCHVGCFPKSHPTTSPIFGYHITDPNTTTSDEVNSTSYILEPKLPLYQSYVQSSPLNTRAWVFQERTLSQRTLYYTKAGLFWECCTNAYSEHDPPHISSIDTTQTAIRPNGLKQLIAFATETEPSSNSMTRATWTGTKEISNTRAEITEQQWIYAMQEYSERNMTFNSDKLPAIAGIAERISTITNEEYLAGIWRKSLLLQSAWTPYLPSSTSSSSSATSGTLERKEVKRITKIPSWSWASIDGPIRFEHADQQEHTHPDFEIVGIIRPHSALSLSESATSIFADCPQLLLRAPLARLRIRRSPPGFARTIQNYNPSQVYFEPHIPNPIFDSNSTEDDGNDDDPGFDRDMNYLRPDTTSDLSIFDQGEVQLLKWMSWDIIRRKFGGGPDGQGGRELVWKWVCAVVVAPVEPEAESELNTKGHQHEVRSEGSEVVGDMRNVQKYRRLGWAHFDLACPLLQDLFGVEGQEEKSLVLLV